MELEFIARNTDLTDHQRELARKKFGRLEKYFNDVLESRLTVKEEKHRVHVDAFIRGKDFEVAAHSETPEWSSSLQEAVDKLEQQARKLKQKLTRPKRSKSAKAEEEPTPEAAVAEPESLKRRDPRVVETRHVPVLPMTVEEAALQLEGSDDDFIVFREASSDRINVLFRRRDRTYGLVTPEY